MPKSKPKKLVLRAFSFTAPEPKIPNRRHKLAACTLKNGTTVELSANWPRKRWFVSASTSYKWKAAQTIATGVATKAAEWEAAINACNVAIEED